MYGDNRNNLGRILWKELHTRAYNHNGSNDLVFIDMFSRKLKRYMTGCSCIDFWKKWKTDNPPIFTKDKYFEWTVRLHNAVNKKLGKPIVQLSVAIHIWSKPSE